MCRAVMVYGNRKPLGAVGYSAALSAAKTSMDGGNTDGYAVVVFAGGRAVSSVRTVSAEEFLNFMRGSRDVIEGADKMLLHFRMATAGKVNKRNVHGWEIGGFYCAHNGIVTNVDAKSRITDSEQYLRRVFSGGGRIADRINRVKVGGGGIFMLASGEVDYVANIGEQSYIASDQNVVVISSKADVLEELAGRVGGSYTFELSEGKRKAYVFGIKMDFDEKRTVTLEAEPLGGAWSRDYYFESDMLITVRNNTTTATAIKPKREAYTSNNWVYDNDAGKWVFNPKDGKGKGEKPYKEDIDSEESYKEELKEYNRSLRDW